MNNDLYQTWGETAETGVGTYGGVLEERDESRAETQRYLEEKPHQQFLSNHDKKKAEMMNGTTWMLSWSMELR